MQHTKTYDLNLIETSDTFSPAPLNENMEKLEAAITAGADAEAQARTDAVAALDARVTTLEGHHVAAGTFTNSGSDQIIELGFYPLLVIIQPGYNVPTLVTRAGSPQITLVANGFRASGNLYTSTYSYFAIC